MSIASLSVGIIGLPNVGKSTLFNALLKKQVALASNYPFATIEPNVGIAQVPDPRLQKLAEIVKKEFHNPNSSREIPEKITPATVKFVDIAGLVKGASSGQGLGNKFLSHIREVDAIAHVVRDFSDPEVIREGSVEPKSDLETIEMELALADIELIERRIERVKSELKKPSNSELSKELEGLHSILEKLSKGTRKGLNVEELEIVKKFNLLFFKPKINVYNIDEDKINSYTGSTDGNVYLSAKLENELSMLDDQLASELMAEYGIQSSGLDMLVKMSFQILNLQSYFTAGPKEVKSWAIPKICRAPQAAGVIHSDFEKGFISAQIVSYEDLLRAGSFKNSSSLGLLRIEGRDYIMQDGDVVEFRFNV